MIVSRIDGGLGNQLFQAAFGLQLARTHDTELVLDLSSYQDRPAHGYLLDQLDFNARHLQAHERRRLPRRYRMGTKSSRRSISNWLTNRPLKRIRERPFGFAEKHLRARDNSYLVGYWQSERYFPDVHDEIRGSFRPRVPLSPSSQRLRERMQATPSLALHVRRGDYLSNRQSAAIYVNLSLDYYRQCVAMHLAARPEAEVYVFSNDLAWCHQHLALPCPVHFVEQPSGVSAVEDLWLMTAAQCNVIANSTFSWWGAWLNERPDSRTLAPVKWFQPGTLDDRFLACDRWTLVADSLAPTASLKQSAA